MRLLALIGLTALLLPAQPPPAPRKLLLISIDGLKAETLHNLGKPGYPSAPILRQLRDTGMTWDGINGVLPTITYPNHTAIVTGASPSVHGIDCNVFFDPEGKINGGWNWYAERIKVPALWDLARSAGLKTAGIFWPATVGAAIDFNFPERRLDWHSEDILLQRAITTPGLFREFEAEFGPPPTGETTDKMRTAMTTFLIRTKRPDVIFLHIIDLDHAQHSHGPGSPEANKVLEEIDHHLGQIRDAVNAAGDRDKTVWAIVSDHGFRHHRLTFHPTALLNSLGLFPSAKGPNWRVGALPTGGSFALYAKDPADRDAITMVKNALQQLHESGNFGIEKVMDRAELDRLKAFPGAFLAVSLREPYSSGGNLTGPWITENRTPGGTHGAISGSREMQSVFILAGNGIAARKMPTARIIDIAPTIAPVLGLKMPPATEGKSQW